MKYLIIGDANSMHIFNYVKTVLEGYPFEIHLLTLSTERVKESYRRYYREHHITLHSIAEKYGGDVPNHTRKVRLHNLLQKLKLFRELPKIDLCHIHSVYKTSILFYLLNRRKFSHLIASYWGGDVENKAPFVVKIRERCFRFADVITVTTKKTYEDFEAIYGDQFQDKLKVCRFATAGIACIHDIAACKTAEDCKKELGIPAEKICITCGYSAYEDQHQDVILQKIGSLPDDTKKNLFVVVPMQYGRYNQPYIDRVHNEAEKCGCQVRILEDYYPFEKNAALSLATDIYIHMRDTDAFSNSLKEQIYAGSKTIIGSWLKYYELEEMKAPVVWAHSFDELPGILRQLISDISVGENQLFTPIYSLYSPEHVKEEWDSVIRICVKSVER